MGLFSSILGKLGFGEAKASTPTAPVITTAAAPAAAAPPPPVAIPVTQLLAELETKAASAGQKLNWKTSIVDLLKLLDIDSSFAARKDLAVELGAPAEVMKDSASMNIWLHKTVLAKIAQNGGDIPKDLLD
jgi:hypothetical protein